MTSKNLLLQQLENERFEHALTYVRNESVGLKKLSTSELVRLNQHLVGSKTEDPWRVTAVEVNLPSGDTHHFSIVGNPLQKARDILGHAWLIAGNQDLLGAASYLYSNMVLEHLFNDANRRTAVLAVLWLANAFHKDLDPHKLLNCPIGNLRKPEDLSKLTKIIQDSFK